MGLRRLLLLAAGAWLWTTGAAAEDLRLCYNYGCQREERVHFPATEVAHIRGVLALARDAEDERQILSWAVGRMYRLAARQLPIGADRPGDLLDEGVNGRMDCIDHAVDSTRILALFQREGALRFHRVVAPALRRRFLIFQHFSAQLAELPGAGHGGLKRTAHAGGNPLLAAWLGGCPVCADDARVGEVTQSEARPGHYAIDSWFVESGAPAVVLPLDDWLDGGGPNVQ